jgi:hypothetical protein
MPSPVGLRRSVEPSPCPTSHPAPAQAPPSDRKYRAALATAIEPCGASFRRLISAALTSESRLLRAAVVRVLARAGGLGGGMGPFLAEPLLEELQTVAESPAPLHDARRLLEVGCAAFGAGRVGVVVGLGRLEAQQQLRTAVR